MDSTRSLSAVRNSLRENRKNILRDLEDYSMVAEHLYEHNILGKRMYQEIKTKSVQMDAVPLILDAVERAKVKGLYVFCNALNEDYNWLAQELLNSARKHGLSDASVNSLDTSKVNSQGHENPNHVTASENGAGASSINLRHDDDSVGQFSAEFLDSVPSELQLLKLAKEISVNEWELLAFELGLTLSDIEKVKQNSNVTIQVHGMLVTWTRLQGNDATFRILVDALKNSDMEHIMSRIGELS